MNDNFCLIFATAGSQDEAERLATMLVDKQLAACVQILGISSTYSWDGVLHQDPEWLLMIKTKSELYPQIEDALRTHHSYEVPEIIQLPIIQGSAPYLAWINKNTRNIP